MLLFLMLMTGFAGFVDSAAGGGGLISLPAYMVTGLPVHLLYGANKFSSACGTTFASAMFFRSGALDLQVALIAAAASFAGSTLGSRLVLLLPGFFVEGFRLLRTMLRQRRSGGLSALAVVGAALLLAALLVSISMVVM